MRSQLITTFSDKPYRYPQHKVWFFDLDNTLHDASYAIFDLINQGMTKAVMQNLQIDKDKANELRVHYWQRYGATMLGLKKHHQINVNDFLKQSHDFEVASHVKAEHGLADLLKQISGKKIILTNAPKHYALQVIEALNIKPYLDGICAVDQMCLQGRYRPKPAISLLQQLEKQMNAYGKQCILVEDTIDNLKTAKQLNWQTIHIYHASTPFARAKRNRPSFVDVSLRSLDDLRRLCTLW